MSVFGEYAKFYDALYKDKDYMSEAKVVDSLLRKYGSDVKEVLVLGCGTGRHDRCLKQLGYQIHGIDMSEDMIKEAKTASTDIEYEVCDIRDYKTDKKYDAVVSLFHVMSYQTTNDDIKKSMQTARSALKIGGILLFDVWYGPGVLTDRPYKRVKEVEWSDHRIIRTATPTMHPNENIVDVRYDFQISGISNSETEDLTEVHHMRYFFKPEMNEYMLQTGFKMLDCIDCNDLGEPDFDSWTAYFVAKPV